MVSTQSQPTYMNYLNEKSYTISNYFYIPVATLESTQIKIKQQYLFILFKKRLESVNYFMELLLEHCSQSKYPKKVN